MVHFGTYVQIVTFAFWESQLRFKVRSRIGEKRAVPVLPVTGLSVVTVKNLMRMAICQRSEIVPWLELMARNERGPFAPLGQFRGHVGENQIGALDTVGSKPW